MTQQPFSRPGAIDLSALKRPAPTQPAASGGAGASAGGAAGGGAYSVDVDETSFQQVAELSMTAPVVLVFHSPSQSPQSTTFAQQVAATAEQYDGRFLVGLIDVDGSPQIAQMMQIEQIPLLLVMLDARPVTQPLPGIMSEDEINALFQQLGQQLTAQGVTGRHQPRAGAAAGADTGEADAEGAEEPQSDPRYRAAEDALGRNDIDTAVAEYQKLVDANPADHEAAGGLAMATVLQRTQGADPATARQAAEAAPDDLDAQSLAADVDLVEGRVEEAFDRLIELVRRSTAEERTGAREHLLGLFAAVGNDDPQVLAARRKLASALY